jgi:Flp pilus assembly protein TadD
MLRTLLPYPKQGDRQLLRSKEDLMNPKKQKVKDRRRARKLADEAWEAANQGNLDLAEKIIRRAVAAREDNPVLWNDLGVLLRLRQKDVESAESFYTALSLAPTYAEPYAHLATFRFRQGFAKDAVALQERAVKYAPVW